MYCIDFFNGRERNVGHNALRVGVSVRRKNSTETQIKPNAERRPKKKKKENGAGCGQRNLSEIEKFLYSFFFLFITL